MSRLDEAKRRPAKSDREASAEGERLRAFLDPLLEAGGDFSSDDLLRGIAPLDDATLRVLVRVAERAAERAAAGVRRQRDSATTALSPLLSCTHDLDGVLVAVDERAASLLGYSPSDLVGRPLRDFIEPGAVHGLETYLRELRQTGRAEGIFRVVARGGQIVVLRFQSGVCPLESGTGTARAEGRAVDVTLLWDSVNLARRESHATLRATLEAVSEAILIVGRDGEVRMATGRFRALWGDIGENFPAYLRGAGRWDVAEPEAFLGRVELLLLDPATEAEGALQMVDGRVLTWTSTPLGAGSFRGRTFAFRDVTRAQAADRRLRESEELYRSLFENNGAGAYRIGVDGRFLDCNTALARHLGFESRGELMERNASEFVFSSGDRDGFLVRARANGRIHGEEVCLRRRDGSPGWFISNADYLPGATPADDSLAGTLVDVTELRRAAERLADSEDRYRLLFDGSPLPMLLWDFETRRILAANHAAKAFYGFPGNEIRSVLVTDLLSPAGRQDFESHWRDRDSEESISRAGVQRTKAGDSRSVHVTGHGMKLGDRVVRFEAVLDMTERTAALRRLTESEARYRSLFEGIPLPAWHLDAGSLAVLQENDAAQRLYGRRDLPAGSTYVTDLAVAEQRPAFAAWLRSPQRESGARFEHVRSDGSTIQVECVAQGVESELGATLILVGADVTERLRAEEATKRLQASVRETAREWAVTFDAIESPVLVTDSQGVIQRLNRAALLSASLQRSGLRTYSDVVGRRADEMGPAQPWRALAEAIRESGGGRGTKTSQAVDATTGTSWQIIASPDRDSGRIVLVAHDITLVTELQSSVARAQTMAAIGALVSGVAHEARNPLFGISATLDALETRFAGQPDYLELAQVLRRQSQRLLTLMQELLDYGKPSKLELRAARFEDVVSLAIESCAHEAERRGVRVESSAEGPLPEVVIDANRIAQALRNLVENAVQHSPRGGTVSVVLKGIEGPHRAVECRVEDRGTGFPEEHLHRAFEPFFSRRRGGTGLGLSIVRRFLDLHGGTIAASNRDGGGTAMVLRLPARPPDGSPS
ncbi:MAG: PAS domain S-box protein [Acidobacteria bacterium]|nr:PAS domain S-box protein [Acidobacteriota bacterium]